jgi:hypothetical protein
VTLEIDDNIEWQRRLWSFERWGWLVLLLILIGAALGLAGDGVLAAATASSANGVVTVEYPRYLRAKSPQRLSVLLAPPAGASGDTLSLWLDAAYLEDVIIERISPEPARIEAGMERRTFEFAWDGSGPVPVTFEVTMRGGGRLVGRIGSGAEAVTISQLVYP